MELTTWDDEDSRSLPLSGHPATDTAAVLAAVASLDWERDRLCGVTISRSPRDWAEGSGSLHPNHGGLSLMIEQGGEQHVARTAPASPDEIAQFLLAYMAEDHAAVFQRLYDRTPTPEELERFVFPEPPALSSRGCFYAAFGAFVLFMLVAALLAHCGAR